MRAYCAAHPDFVQRAVGLVRVRHMNPAAPSSGTKTPSGTSEWK